jgi:hypothetical protein
MSSRDSVTLTDHAPACSRNGARQVLASLLGRNRQRRDVAVAAPPQSLEIAANPAIGIFPGGARKPACAVRTFNSVATRTRPRGVAWPRPGAPGFRRNDKSQSRPPEKNFAPFCAAIG